MTTKQKVLNFEVKQVGNEEDRVLRFIGSDSSVDRDGDVIEVDGWVLDDYQKNPTFLWAHNYATPPLGKAIRVAKEGGKLVFDIKFAKLHELSTDITNPSEHAKFVDTIYNMYKHGYLNATSVGFDPIEYKERDDEAAMKEPAWKRGVRFMKQSLLELSAVPVPANPNAVQLAYQKGVIPNKEIAETIEKAMDIEQKDPTPVVVEKKSLSDDVVITSDGGITLGFVPNGPHDHGSHHKTLDESKKQAKSVDDMKMKIDVDAKAVAEELMKLMSEEQQKAGRVISRNNEERLRTAISMLQEVLDEVNDDDPVDEALMEEAKGLMSKLEATNKGQSGIYIDLEDDDEPYFELGEQGKEVEIEVDSLKNMIQETVQQVMSEWKTSMTGRLD